MTQAQVEDKNLTAQMFFIAAFAFCFFSCFQALDWRASGHWPQMFWDEYAHSTAALHQGAWSNYTVAPVFNALYGTTGYCGDGYVECARGLNSLVQAAGLIPIYFLARQFATPWPALGLACLGVLGPQSIYTAYFTPEALYFLVFWLFAWFTLSPHQFENRRAILLGFGITTLSAIKVHGLFLLPGVIGFSIWQAWRTLPQQLWIQTALRFAMVLVLACSLSRSLMIAQLADTWNPLYKGIAYSESGLLPHGLDWLTWLFFLVWCFWAHAVNGLLVAGLPLWLMGGPFRLFERLKNKEDLAFPVVLITFTVPVVAITLAFSVAEANWQQIQRGALNLHARYYNYLFPLILLSVGQVLAISRENLRVSKTSALVFFLFVLLAAITFRRLGFSHAFTAPEFYTMGVKSLPMYALLSVTVGATTLALRNYRRALYVYLGVFLPLFFLNGWYFGYKHLVAESTLTYAERAGIAVRQRLRQEKETGEILIWSSNLGYLARAGMQLNLPHVHPPFNKRPGADPFISEQGEPYKWVLALDRTLNDPRWKLAVQGERFWLYQRQEATIP